ncbi:DUF2345 domain-containing protein, partial [Escherichia coli]|nr:DUF2345 domain-containing protein [Escherichia coli]
ITSTEDEIKITAKKKITLNGGGSYIRLDACGVEAGKPGEYNVKGGNYWGKPKEQQTPGVMGGPGDVRGGVSFTHIPAPGNQGETACRPFVLKKKKTADRHGLQ